MSPSKGKWEAFKANSSNLNVSSPDLGSANVRLDWLRASLSCRNVININGVPLRTIAKSFNNFAKDEDVVNFFDQIILKDFQGSKEEKQKAIDYLKITFHQGGLLYPVSSALSTELKNRKGEQIFTLNDSKRFSSVNIVTTPTGFRVQEYAEAQNLVCVTEKAQMDYGPELLEEEVGPIIQAEATIAVDFSRNGKSPSLIVESNHIKIQHEALKECLDKRSWGQRICDFFKNVLGLNKVTLIESPQPRMEGNEDKNDTFYPGP